MNKSRLAKLMPPDPSARRGFLLVGVPHRWHRPTPARCLTQDAGGCIGSWPPCLDLDPSRPRRRRVKRHPLWLPDPDFAVVWHRRAVDHNAVLPQGPPASGRPCNAPQCQIPPWLRSGRPWLPATIVHAKRGWAPAAPSGAARGFSLPRALELCLTGVWRTRVLRVFPLLPLPPGRKGSPGRCLPQALAMRWLRHGNPGP